MAIEIGKTVYRKKDGVKMNVLTQGPAYKGISSWGCSWTDSKTGKHEEDVFPENELTESPSTL